MTAFKTSDQFITAPEAFLNPFLTVALLALEWLVRSETLHHKAVCLDTR